MGLESQSHSPERNPTFVEAPLLRDNHGAVQAVMALKHFKELHPEEQIDTDHPENNESRIRNAAILEFIRDGSAARFSEYRDGHWDTHINVDNPEELTRLFNEILHDTHTLQ